MKAGEFNGVVKPHDTVGTSETIEAVKPGGLDVNFESDLTDKQEKVPDLKSRQLAKRQRKKIKEIEKIFSDKGKADEGMCRALYNIAVASVKEQFDALQQAGKLDTERQAAVRIVSEREDEVRRGKAVQERMHAICIELQQKLKQAALEHDQAMIREAENRKQVVEEMGKMMDGITERVNAQQTQMESQYAENEQLREKLQKMSEALKLSEKLRTTQVAKYEEDWSRLETELAAKGDLATRACTQLQESENRVREVSAQVVELETALKSASETLKKSHKTNLTLANEKKELLGLTAALQEKYTSVTSIATSLDEQCKEKDIQLQKHQLAVTRLEGLCRSLQGKMKENVPLQGQGQSETSAMAMHDHGLPETKECETSRKINEPSQSLDSSIQECNPT